MPSRQVLVDAGTIDEFDTRLGKFDIDIELSVKNRGTRVGVGDVIVTNGAKLIWSTDRDQSVRRPCGRWQRGRSSTRA